MTSPPHTDSTGPVSNGPCGGDANDVSQRGSGRQGQKWVSLGGLSQPSSGREGREGGRSCEV